MIDYINFAVCYDQILLHTLSIIIDFFYVVG